MNNEIKQIKAIKKPKETLVPIHVSPKMKSFIEYKKLVLKRRTGKFVPVEEVIMYYFNNDEFNNDYTKFLAMEE